jgi:hypothetical protein
MGLSTASSKPARAATVAPRAGAGLGRAEEEEQGITITPVVAASLCAPARAPVACGCLSACMLSPRAVRRVFSRAVRSRAALGEFAKGGRVLWLEARRRARAEKRGVLGTQMGEQGRTNRSRSIMESESERESTSKKGAFACRLSTATLPDAPPTPPTPPVQERRPLLALSPPNQRHALTQPSCSSFSKRARSRSLNPTPEATSARLL